MTSFSGKQVPSKISISKSHSPHRQSWKILSLIAPFLDTEILSISENILMNIMTFMKMKKITASIISWNYNNRNHQLRQKENAALRFFFFGYSLSLFDVGFCVIVVLSLFSIVCFSSRLLCHIEANKSTKNAPPSHHPRSLSRLSALVPPSWGLPPGIASSWGSSLMTRHWEGGRVLFFLPSGTETSHFALPVLY